MKIKVILIIVCLLGLGNWSQAQKLKEFTKEPDKYFEELTLWMTASYEGGQKIMNEFHAIWKIDNLEIKDQEKVFKLANSALKSRMKAIDDSVSFTYGPSTQKLTEGQIQFVYETSNAMLKKRLKPSPHFRDYLLTLINLTTTGQSEVSFSAWQKSLNKLIETARSNKIVAYLDFSNKLFSEDVLYKSPSVTWAAGNRNYSFEFDSLPKIVFQNVDLKCYSKGDSSIIYGTAGTYYPTSKLWVGKGGKVKWSRCGIEEKVVKAILSNYKIALKSSAFTADSVTFYNTNFFDEPLKGVLKEKLKANVTVKNASYPRFDSYDKRLQIHNLFDKVNYDGGFSMQGAKLIGSGSKEEEAYVTFKLYFENDSIRRDQERFLVVASKSFVIEDDGITSRKASVTFYLGEDSVYHPQLQMKFLVKKVGEKVVSRQLILIREDKGLARSPYFNTYHEIDMNFEALYWDIDQPRMEFKRLRGIGSESKANFESTDYYRKNRYDRIQGMDPVHPLVELRQFSKKNADTREFWTYQLSDFLRLPIEDVRQSIMHLANMGFLDYNFAEDRSYIKDKTFEYLLDNAGRRDYDVISFNSVTQDNKTNASLNLLNYDLNIDGVASIFLSDSQNVYIYPTAQKIVLKKNRDFIFSGRVHAGLFDFFGRKFSFEYDKFKINLDNVDSLRLSVLGDPDKFGERKITYVKTVIESINGELLIDKPENKSGVKRATTYPIFHSLKDSYTFYQRGSIQNGVYDREKFYFHLEPFTIDSLDNFDPASIALKGNFVSSGIFPDFEEALTVQPDYSLGFSRLTPSGGFSVYDGKANYENQINLTHDGLKGDGVLRYLSSTAISDEFIFFPDSMNAIAQSFEVHKQISPIQYPNLVSENVDIHWQPVIDLMHVEIIDKPFVMYDEEARLNGSVDLEPKGLSGNGIMKFGEAEMLSDLMVFGDHAFDADTAEFKLSTDSLKQIAFKTVNVKAHIDFEERKGVFTSNGEGSYVDFPANQYFCFVDQFTWFMDKGDIELSATSQTTAIEGEEDLKLEGSEFISTHPDQDSLKFVAPRAQYSVRKSIIYAKEVQLINVADARIYPDNGNVTIHKKARMETLENAKIMANVVTRYHNMYNCTVDIKAKKMYTAVGDYDYIDEKNEKQVIHFDEITVDTTAQTYAIGKIADNAGFKLSPKFAFMGDVKLTASKEFVNFSGFTKISHSCKGIISNWFKFSEDINPNAIYLPVDTFPTNLTDDKLSSGILLGKDTSYAYATFLSLQNKRNDIAVLPASGYLFYEKSTQEYLISNKDKLGEIALPGNLVSINTSKCIVYGEGKIDLGQNIGQVKITTLGNATHDLKNLTTDFDLLMTIDFFFEESALKNMAEAFAQDETVGGIDYNRTTYERGLSELLGKDQADKSISEINLYAKYKKMPSALIHTLVFSDLKMYWNDTTGSYVSRGPIGLSNINKKQVHKSLKGYVELLKKRTGDIFTIYLEATEDKWYFFTYQRGLMQAISSDEDFNTIVKEVKAAKRKQATKGGPSYQFIISSVRKKKTFLNKFNSTE